MTSLTHRYKLFLLMVFLLPVMAGAANVTKGPVPAWVNSIRPDINASVPLGEVSGGAYYLLIDNQENAGSRTRYYHFALKIFNQTGAQNNSQVRFLYDKAFHKLVIHEVHIIRDGKVINKLDMTKLKIIQQSEKLAELQYDELMTALLFVEDVQAGDVLEYSYSITSSNPLGKKYSTFYRLQGPQPVARLYFRTVAPPQTVLNIKCLNNAPAPVEKVTRNQHEITWDLKNVAALHMDDETPPGYDPFSEGQISEFKTWGEVKQWALDIYRPFMNGDASVKQKASEIEESYADDTDRIIAALRFVQDRVRYLGIETGVNTHQPHPPGQVMKQGYGDCKDKAVLFCSLLKEMGITAYPVLIRSNGSLLMPDWLPSPFEFDHICARVDYLGRQYYFDPTISYQRGTLHNTFFPNYRYGLVIGDTSRSLTVLPFRREKNNSTTILNKMFIGDTASPVKLEVISTYTGIQADRIRTRFAVNSLEEIQKAYLDFFAQQFQDVSVADSIKVLIDDSASNKIITREIYTIDHLWRSQGNGLRYFWVFADNLKSIIRPPKSRKRTMPFAIRYPVNYTEQFELKLFDDWKVTDEYKKVENDDMLFTYRCNYRSSDSTIDLTYFIHTKKDMTDTAENTSYFKDAETITDSLGYGVQYNPLKHNRFQIFSANYLMLFICLLTCIGTFFGVHRIYLNYDLETEYSRQTPREFSGWLLLPMLAMFIAPLIFLFTLISEIFLKDLIFKSTGADYKLILDGLIAGEVIFHSFLLVFSVFCLVLLLQKRSIFPKMFIIYTSVNIAGSLYSQIPQSHLIKVNYQSRYSIWPAVGWGVIWIFYMLESKRVKETFTRVRQTEFLIFTAPVGNNTDESDSVIQDEDYLKKYMPKAETGQQTKLPAEPDIDGAG